MTPTKLSIGQIVVVFAIPGRSEGAYLRPDGPEHHGVRADPLGQGRRA